MAHADDLRAEVAEQGEKGEALVAAVRSGEPQAASLSEADRRMLDFALRLTRDSRAVTETDIEELRAAGFSDAAIHDIVQITGYFAYYNRLADGLGIDPEPAAD